mgnify:CR=1 FL=1
MRCCQCQKELPDGVPFCKYCGARQTPQEAGEARKEAPQAETIQPVHQPAASPVVEREMPRAATAGETEGPPVPLAGKTEECLPEDTALETAPQAGKAVSTLAEPEREPEVPPDLAVAGETEAQPELPPEETAPAEARESPVPAAAPAPPAPEIRFRDVPEEMEQPARPEPEDLVFDLEQILQKIASADAVEPKSGETTLSVEKEVPLWFDPDEVSQPAAVGENAEPDPETVPLESYQDVTPEQGEAAVAPAELEVEAGGEPADPPAREIPAAEQTVASDVELPPAARIEETPASKPETELPAAEQKEDATALAKQPWLHAEQRDPLPVEEYCPEQREKSTAPTGLKPQGVSGEPAAEASKKREKKPALPILWRLAVIGVELGVIAYLSVRLFF